MLSKAAALRRAVPIAVTTPLQQRRWFNVNPSQQRKQTNEFYSATRFTDFDIDKEKWGKQTQWHTMDCILDPSVDVPATYSIKGLRKRFSTWLTMKKVLERRPGFAPEVELRQSYIDYKRVAFTSDHNQVKTLCRLTTWAEAIRLEQDTKKAQLELELKETEKQGGKSKSWKDLSVKSTNFTPVKQAATAPATATGDAAADAKKPTAATATSGGEEIALDVKTPLMELQIESFDITNVYIGQMTNDDWVQITARVRGKYRTPKTAPIFEQMVEFPVFELKMGDGLTNLNTAPFIVVAVMDRDGSRMGKDGNDAAALRKSLGQSKKQSWFS